MKLTKPEVEAIKDLLMSQGWKIIVKQMNERRSAAVFALMSASDMVKVQRLQLQISELDFLLKAPHQWIK